VIELTAAEHNDSATTTADPASNPTSPDSAVSASLAAFSAPAQPSA
jgi:hypothetical protein